MQVSKGDTADQTLNPQRVLRGSKAQNLRDPRRDHAPDGVLVGWDMVHMGQWFSLKLESAATKQALDADCIDTRRLLITRNQALLLAAYLLDSSDQTLPAPFKVPWWRRLFGA